jgi:hypothetical protein
MRESRPDTLAPVSFEDQRSLVTDACEAACAKIAQRREAAIRRSRGAGERLMSLQLVVGPGFFRVLGEDGMVLEELPEYDGWKRVPGGGYAV